MFLIGPTITLIGTLMAATFAIKKGAVGTYIPKATPPVPPGPVYGPNTETWPGVVKLAIYAGLAVFGWHVAKTVYKWAK